MGRLIHNRKYMSTLCNNPHEWKQRSLEDNVYFTLQDIMLNTSVIEHCQMANKLMEELLQLLTKDISLEEEESAAFLWRLKKVLQSIHIDEFLFEDKEKEDEFGWILLTEWWVQFEAVKRRIWSLVKDT